MNAELTERQDYLQFMAICALAGASLCNIGYFLVFTLG